MLLLLTRYARSNTMTRFSCFGPGAGVGGASWRKQHNFEIKRLSLLLSLDSQVPSFGVSCPNSSLLSYAEKGTFSALVNWTNPVATDNSGLTPKVTSNFQSPQNFSQGDHVITYTAVDQSGNKATCRFTVKVIFECTNIII